MTIKSLSLVCSAVHDVESAVETALDIFCHEELGATSNCWTCAGEVLAAANGCLGKSGVAACVQAALGAGSDCVPCICEIVTCD